MTSRERVRLTLNHQKPDRVPLDLGGTQVTGIQALLYKKLREALGVRTGGLVRVYEPFQMLAEVEEEIRRTLAIDIVGISFPQTMFGYKNDNWKPFTMFDGTEVLVSGFMEYDVLPNGDIVQYPQGCRSAPPSAKMPKDGFYFDNIIRQQPIEEDSLDPAAWVDQTYSLYSDEDLRFLEEAARYYYENTEYSLVGNFWGAGLGDIAFVPGPNICHPIGIRDLEEWFISFISRKQYIQDIFNIQHELQMKNLKMYREAVGDRLDVIVMGGTDFGSQNGPFFAPQTYREMFKPFHKIMNDWVHAHTEWKTFYHTCGAIVEFFDDFSEAGMDILNPVQISAARMDPAFLKSNYGDKFVFWGGGVDTQKTLPFGTPEEVRQEVERNISIFSKEGGFVFASVHNIQATVPLENLLALFQSFREFR